MEPEKVIYYKIKIIFAVKTFPKLGQKAVIRSVVWLVI